jgi:hypothetical protein
MEVLPIKRVTHSIQLELDKQCVSHSMSIVLGILSYVISLSRSNYKVFMSFSVLISEDLIPHLGTNGLDPPILGHYELDRPKFSVRSTSLAME